MFFWWSEFHYISAHWSLLLLFIVCSWTSLMYFSVQLLHSLTLWLLFGTVFYVLPLVKVLTVHPVLSWALWASMTVTLSSSLSGTAFNSALRRSCSEVLSLLLHLEHTPVSLFCFTLYADFYAWDETATSSDLKEVAPAPAFDASQTFVTVQAAYF